MNATEQSWRRPRDPPSDTLPAGSVSWSIGSVRGLSEARRGRLAIWTGRARRLEARGALFDVVLAALFLNSGAVFFFTSAAGKKPEPAKPRKKSVQNGAMLCPNARSIDMKSGSYREFRPG
jgi:hypothetical protein